MISRSIKTCFRKFFVFEGRACRAEFWGMAFWMIFLWVSQAIFHVDFNIFHGSISIFFFWLFVLAALVFMIPFITCTCRRLHDVGKPAAYIFIVLIPIVGLILLIIALASKSDEANNYGKPEVW